MISLWARFKRLAKVSGAMFYKRRCVCMFAPPLQQSLNTYPHWVSHVSWVFSMSPWGYFYLVIS